MVLRIRQRKTLRPTSEAGAGSEAERARLVPASQSDELSIKEGEELQVIEDGDMEDWLKVSAALLLVDQDVCVSQSHTCVPIHPQVCNSCGQVGYVPERYVQFLCLPAEEVAQLDSSFNSTSALYSYQAQSAEELSFQEGALIHLIRCQQGEVDDGFWEGELNGRTGVFPSLVVELVYDEGKEEEKQEEEEPLPTPATPLLSTPITISLSPGCSSVLRATPPTCMENQLADSTADHMSPDLCSSRLRPVCNSIVVEHLRQWGNPIGILSGRSYILEHAPQVVATLPTLHTVLGLVQLVS
ncbi:hypothetical protein INR49_024674 [Caranx melampygus]|nr:hypothetical protein INR49_024674 [Caranx melampygus]